MATKRLSMRKLRRGHRRRQDAEYRLLLPERRMLAVVQRGAQGGQARLRERPLVPRWRQRLEESEAAHGEGHQGSTCSPEICRFASGRC